ncbi:zinc-binding dehydrogenase [Pseudonocardia sp. N23]|uniref:zinc-binding dehydrogenase n=1 Tax=Pseudonocardia sp. N23 TaxID=1987376 RepID=UPI000BFE8FB6|nr:zinc-binding dehydrogenase [Pseudonocardia sp. N23]GAY09456.1 alcohol dehydrogenase [Pseudonocardia sp. N23]
MGTSMRAAQLVAPGRIEAVDVPVPVPAAGEVLVRSSRGSICGSDLHIVFDGFHRGAFPAAPGFPGHEGVGVVEESRDPAFAPGDAVLAVPVPRDARCFAQWQVVKASSLVPLPHGGDRHRLLMAQQLGTAIFAMRRFWPPAVAGPAEGRTIAICGAGSAGLFFTALARLADFATVVVADKAPVRLAIAADYGADVVVDVRESSFVDAVMETTSGLGADLVVEAVGYDETRIQCLQAVRTAGRVGYFGFPERPDGPSTWSYNDAWVRRPTIEHSHSTQSEPGLTAFREAVGLIHSGAVDVTPFLDPVYPLDRVQEAFEAARDRRGGKIAVDLT